MSSSAHFSYPDLYSVIVNNDLPGTEKAVLCLGARIHVVQVWCGRTAMEYAARLGHVEQARTIFRDLERYFEDDNYKSSSRISSLFRELIPHREEDADFMRELLTRYPQDWASNVDELVLAGAFDLLESLLTERDDCIPPVVESCFRLGQTRVFHVSEWLQRHPVFLKELQQRRENDLLEVALMQGDWPEAFRLITQALGDSNTNFPCAKTSARQKALPIPRSGPRTFSYMEKELSCPSFVRLVVITGDLDMVNRLLNEAHLTLVLQLTKLSKSELVEFIMSAALYTESLGVVEAILSKRILDHRQVGWWHLYYDLIVDGKFKSAMAIKRFCPRYLGQGTKKQLFQIFGNNKPAIQSMKPDTPAGIVCEVVDAMESFPRNRPSYNSQWRRSLYSFPVENGRPDVAEHFRRYGYLRSEADVILETADRSSRRLDFLRALSWDTETLLKPSLILNNNDRTSFAKAFLGDQTIAVQITSSRLSSTAGLDSEPTTLFGELLRECVSETGKSAECENARGDLSEFLVQIESLRRESLTLKKQCRLSIRRCIRVANPKKSLEDGVLSLYVDGHLPRPVVRYLLYRNEGVHQPLYYRLVKPIGQSGSSHDDALDSDSESNDMYDWILAQRIMNVLRTELVYDYDYDDDYDYFVSDDW